MATRRLGSVLVVVPVAVLAIVTVVLAVDAAGVSPGDLFGVRFEPALGRLGLVPLAPGTLATTLLAVVFAAPVALVAAVWLAELCPRRLQAPLATCVDGLASVPAVVYGVWGRLEIVPLVRDHLEPSQPSVASGHGFGLFTASLVLALMCLPSVTAVALRVLRGVPAALRETSASLGATRWQTVRHAVLPAARAGLAGAVLFGVGRAVGESIAITMVIGGRPGVPSSLFDPTSTLAVALVDGLEDATHPEHLGALAAAALLLAVLGALAMSSAQRRLSPAEASP
jgi:phosphate transport system permease protein